MAFPKQLAFLIIWASAALTSSSSSCQGFLETSTATRRKIPLHEDRITSHTSSILPSIQQSSGSLALWSTAGNSVDAVVSDPNNAWNAPSALYDADPSDQRYSASDWWHNMKSLPRSSILREIKGPVLTLMAWSTLISAIHQTLLLSPKTDSWAKFLSISSTPHSFLVSALGLLLVFRTNTAYQRFEVGNRMSRAIAPF
jgi:hypothetical protein